MEPLEPMDPLAEDLAVVEACARAAHDVNNHYCTLLGEPNSPPWDGLTEPQKKGIMQGVRGVFRGVSHAESHAAGMATRVAEGWTFGPTKSFEAKTSPCLVPYEDLAPAQRLKDGLFAEIVSALGRTYLDARRAR